jgi:four helix bundle protein
MAMNQLVVGGATILKGDDISDRLLEFGVRVIRLVGALPKSMASRHIAGQLLRCGTSCGANYEEARGGESRADFIHKLAISWKETRESLHWLRLIHRAQMVKPGRIDGLIVEAKELSLILGKSLATARGKNRTESRDQANTETNE